MTDNQAEPDVSLSPTLLALRDIIAAMPGRDGAELAAARVLLAAHTRELADLIEADIRADREREHTGRRNVYAHRGGMMSARQVLDRYADDLDAAAIDAEDEGPQPCGESGRICYHQGHPDHTDCACGCDCPRYTNDIGESVIVGNE